jgi:hypothetical protein
MSNSLAPLVFEAKIRWNEPAWTLLVCLLLSLGVTPASAQSLRVGQGQLGAPIEHIPSTLGNGLVHKAQRTVDGALYLTPNESFFPQRGLYARGACDLPDVDELNKGQMFDYITGWQPGAIAEWGIWIERPGELIVEFWMSNTTGQETLTVDIVDLQTAPVKLKSNKSDTPKLVGKARLRLTGIGQHVLHVQSPDASSGVRLHHIKVTGHAASDAALLRKRWRPAAAHTRFSSSVEPKNVRLWIMEMDAVPGELPYYSPVTTPFGYYGPSWLADGRVNISFNFSLWSYKRGAPEPPIEQLSHLLAIGNPTALFDGFGHEGTGVKVRGWDPLEGRQNQRQALALRVEPGEMYDTYFSYFYAADEKRWRLFGVGNKWNKGKPLESLWVGSFVEVPGPPDRQRTGTTVRKMRYRGWVMDSDGKLLPLDRMSVADVDKATGLTYTDRGMQADGWFAMETGGWVYRPAPQGDYVKGDVYKHEFQPEYIQPKAIQALLSVPSVIEPTSIDRRGAKATVTFNITNASKQAEAWIYHGSNEGLTLADRWANKVVLMNPKEGANTVTIDAPAGQPLQVRLLLKNDEGQFWSTRTFVLEK